MKVRFQTYLLVLFLPLLLLVQGATILLVYDTTRAHIADQSRQALIATSASFQSWLNATVERLAHSSRILAADFGFRSAIASRDDPTIRSALENSRARISADEIMLIGLGGEILMSPLSKNIERTPFENPDLLAIARTNGQAAALIEMRRKIFQFVVVPVRAPDVIGWIGIGIEVTDGAASSLKARSTIPVDVTFAFARPGEAWTPVATTLPQDHAAALPPAMSRIYNGADFPEGEFKTTTLDLGHESYTTSVELLNDSNAHSRVAAVIQYSLSAALAPHAPLFVFLISLASVGFIVTILAVVGIARGVTRPIRALDLAAGRIESGDYQQTVAVTGPEEINRLAETFNAMVEGIASREKQIERQANYDETTGLPNRQFLERFLKQKIARCASDERFTLFAINLENFADIDNTLGYELGDSLLGDAAGRIGGCLKASDRVFRSGRDKFVVLSALGNSNTIDLIVGRIHLAFDAPYFVADINIDVGVRVGVATYPEHGSDHRTLLRRLDIAAESLDSGFKPYAMYDPDSDRYTAQRLALMSELREGLRRDELELYYQPKVDLQTNDIAQAEALMRWNHPVRGLVSPDEFIGLAERTGFIRHMTRWALTRAIEDCRDWRAAGYPMVVSVNVSAKDLVDPTLPSFITQELTRCKLDTDAVVLEITESAVMERPEFAIELLKSLAAMNLQISIDDFGTGQSSMAYVKQLPAKELKIDKSFVTHLADHREDQIVVRAAIQLGRDLGMKLTAEGIEDQYSAEYLRDLGCDYGQGWFFARPMPKAAFEQLLLEKRTTDSAGANKVTNIR